MGTTTPAKTSTSTSTTISTTTSTSTSTTTPTTTSTTTSTTSSTTTMTTKKVTAPEPHCCPELPSEWFCSSEFKRNSLCVRFCDGHETAQVVFSETKKCYCKNAKNCYWTQKGPACNGDESSENPMNAINNLLNGQSQNGAGILSQL